jgi:hypothetical protein
LKELIHESTRNNTKSTAHLLKGNLLLRVTRH